MVTYAHFLGFVRKFVAAGVLRVLRDSDNTEVHIRKERQLRDITEKHPTLCLRAVKT
jgi:E3 ubiquitin-protein ligase DOA10